MKDEIKEILDELKDDTYVPLEDGRDYKLLYKDDDKQLLDYITNLQEEINKLIAESTEWESRCYKLQEKNERLTQGVVLLTNKLIDMTREKVKYKSRNEKTIEYIKKYLQEHIIDEYPDEQSVFYDEQDKFIPNAKEQLLNILQGNNK